MTDLRESARKLVAVVLGDVRVDDPPDAMLDSLQQHVEAALREAVEQEREACLNIAKSMVSPIDITAAIRARAKEGVR